MANPRYAVFLDRDGTLNEEIPYLYRPEDWVWAPGALDAIRGFNRLGLLVIVVSNQSGIARGYFNHQDVDYLHHKIGEWAWEAGARINGFYYCPHHSEYGEERNCNCRKPRPGLLLRTQQDFNIDLTHSFMIGDKAIDIQAGQAVGAISILVTTGCGKEEQQKLPAHQLIAGNLYEAYGMIAAHMKNMNWSNGQCIIRPIGLGPLADKNK